MYERRGNRQPVVVLTALDVEYEAVRDRLAGLRPLPPVSGTRFEAGSLPAGAGEVVLALTGQGNHASAVIAERAVREFTPSAVLFVGVAGRLRPSLALGDVVVATHVYAYHGAAARAEGLRSRPRVWEIDHGIDQAARQIARRGRRDGDPHGAAPGPRVHFGPVASGEVLHDARVSEPLRWIREHYDDALAIEMEAAGVAKAGQLSAAPVAVIRAISDRADGTKSGTDGQRWQQRAARHAAAFATALAADLITEAPARDEPERRDPGVHVETHGGSHGAVAGTIHGGVHTYYQLPPDATPAKKREAALFFLASGQATTARRLLSEVIVAIRDSNEVWFHWLLAFFSGRTHSELSDEDRQCWKAALAQIDELPRDCWSPGIDAIRRLEAASQSRTADEAEIAGIRRDIDRLDAGLRNEVLRHLERVLQGALKDELWHRDVQQARAGQTAERRRDRVWKFFEPNPADPRTREVRPPDVPPGTVAFAAVMSAVAAGAAGTLGWLALQRDDTSALIALVVALIAAGVALRNGAEWRYRADGMRAELRRWRTRNFPSDVARPGGFTHQVDRCYLRYARRYAPEGPDRAAWFGDAHAPMSRLRDEICEVYREQRVTADEVRWLIRFQVRELRRQWDAGALVDHRRRWRIPGSVRAGTAAGVVAAMASLTWAVQAAARQNLVQAAGAVVALAAAGWVAAVVGVRIAAENKRVAVEEDERQRRETAYWFEHQRWQHRLSDRPDDMEMAQWLDCDRRILLQHALAAYQLKWSDISAYASMEARGDDSRRARAKNGPWRYSRYKLLVFLLTADGVRQITVELNFARASFHHWERTNYRYDAVAAVRMTLRDDDAREFQLFLVNGAVIEVAVTEPGEAGADEDAEILANGAQDATGLRNTLFVLEGVAAEGRRWWDGPAYRRAS